MSAGNDVTALLQRWRSGDEGALDRMIPLVYQELHAIAGRLMRKERQDHTLQATALVHEAYARLVGAEIPWQDRAHFFAIAARQMRRILVDHAKSRGRHKRGGELRQVTLESAAVVQPDPPSSLVELDEALSRLALQDPRRAQTVELHFFGGLTIDEISTALEVSTATVSRDLKFAKAWLYRELQPDGAS
jgi:RNA polymerase sigma factor (TIGR02999 family)